MQAVLIMSDWSEKTIVADIISMDEEKVIVENEYKDGWKKEFIMFEEIMAEPEITGIPVQKVFSFS